MMDHKYTYDLPGLLACLEDMASGWEKLASDSSLSEEDVNEFNGIENECPACEFDKYAVLETGGDECSSCPMAHGWGDGRFKCLGPKSYLMKWGPWEGMSHDVASAAAIAKEARERADAVREAIRRGAE